MSILVIDMGTSSVRASIVHPDATVDIEVRRETLPDTPVQGLVEFDATAYADAALDCAREALDRFGPVEAVGIANQRASTIVWDRNDGRSGCAGAGLAGPSHGGRLPRPRGRGPAVRSQPVRHQAREHPRRGRSRTAARTCASARPESWMIWQLTEGAHHVADLSNAAVSGPARPGRDPLQRDGTRSAPHPGIDAAADRRLDRRHRPGDGIGGRAGDRGRRRRPAGVADRPGVRPARAGEGHVRHRRDDGRVPR